MKYLICEHVKRKGDKADLRPTRPKYVLLFSDHLVHAECVPKGMRAVSAGDISLTGRQGVHCTGHSASLNLTPKDYGRDEKLIEAWLAFGESMMVLGSLDYDAT